MKLRDVCYDHDIVVGAKTAEQLRTELIVKVSHNTIHMTFERKTVDYSAITVEEVHQLKPMATREACRQHGIVLGAKSATELRAELVAKILA